MHRVTQNKFENTLRLRLIELDEIIAKNRENPNIGDLACCVMFCNSFLVDYL